MIARYLRMSQSYVGIDPIIHILHRFTDTQEPDYINVYALRRRLMAQPAGLTRFPNVVGYASTQRILELYGNPHTPLLPDVGK